jgi:putative glutamine amidotransferase
LSAAEGKILIGVTQRVTVIEAIQEKRDSLAQDWGRFLAVTGLPWVALPNRPREAAALAGQLNLSGLLLTGGDDLGQFPERDETEFKLLDWSAAVGKPVLGVCRGFQVIQTWLGGRLQPLEPALHVRTRHEVRHTDGRTVNCNSFHAWGILEPASSLEILARCQTDDSVEAARSGKLLGLMWHPEREEPPHEFDLHLFTRHLGAKPV